MSTHPRPLRPTSTEQDLVVSSSEPLATDTSLSNLTSLASIEMEDLPAATVDASTQTTPVKPVSKQTLWGWLRRTEIKSNALDLLARLLFLIFLVGLGTFFLIEYSTAAEATAKANRLALFTARVSFPDQPKIYISNFCEKSSDTGLEEFAKCDKASVSPPVLWNMDVLAEALQIIQPAWQFEAVCGMEMVLYPPDLTLVLSIPISTSENCHLDCLEPIPVSTSKKPGLKLCFTRLIVCIWSIISPIFLRGTFHWRVCFLELVLFPVLFWPF
ncbi:hypothetical protein ACHAO1_002474 [Botrytis cinerea]